MNVLSVFDGMSCGQIALQRAGILYNKYYASEINKHAIKITQRHFPNTVQLGNIEQVQEPGEIDLFIGGSPCQGFSFSGKQLKFDDPRSQLIFHYFRLLEDIRKYNPQVKFLLENVKMDKDCELFITKVLGVRPLCIDSALVSAQSRLRLYWTNIPMREAPADKHILLRDIIDEGFVDRDKSYCIDANYSKGNNSFSFFGTRRQVVSTETVRHTNDLFPEFDRDIPLYNRGQFRTLTVKEVCRLQTVDDTWFDGSGIANSHIFNLLGNGWTIDVIAHIFKYIKQIQ